jgi:hypothetical protein
MFLTHGSMAFEFTSMHGANFLVHYITKHEFESPFTNQMCHLLDNFSHVTKFDNFVMGVVTIINSIDLWIVEPTMLPMSLRGLNWFHHMVTNLYIRPTKPHLLMWTLRSST